MVSLQKWRVTTSAMINIWMWMTVSLVQETQPKNWQVVKPKKDLKATKIQVVAEEKIPAQNYLSRKTLQ